MLGRFIFGISTGIFSATLQWYFNETVPLHLSDTVQVASVFAGTFGSIIAFMLGEILPDDKDTDSLRNTERWRIIYVYFPLTLYIITLSGFIFILKEDSIKFLIS